MPQRYSQKTVNNFVKGLITEAGELTFPEGASVDELNCDLRRDGSRRRRLGVSYEENNVLSTFTFSTQDTFSTGTWSNAGGLSDKEFLVIQQGTTLRFYDKGSVPYSDGEQSFTVDLTTYEHAGSAGANTEKCQFASIQGYLVVSSAAIDTFFIEYDDTTQTISEETISISVRDFEWQGDTSTYFEEVATASASTERKYDTYNAGWLDQQPTGDNVLNEYLTDNSAYPPLTHPWYSGKDSNGDFNDDIWKKVYTGTTLTGNGKFILDFYAKDRSTASGVSGIAIEYENSRFKSVAAFSGRIWYAGLESQKNSGNIFFSKVIENSQDFGKCYQTNDPTSEVISDLLDSDGGVIKIPDAINIKIIYPFQQSIFVFAENGVWQITGVDGVFKASAYAVNKVSRVGIRSPQSFVSADGTPIWWSQYGIQTLSFDPVSGGGQENNITASTIQSFWDAISPSSKDKVVSVYDSISKRCYWFYPDNDETVDTKLNNVLVLDLNLEAFYPWRVSDETSTTDYLLGGAFYTGFGAGQQELTVTTDGDTNTVYTASGGSDVNAGSFVTNTIYIIKTVGTTDFTLIGASSNTVGEVFTATGAGSGTGVATTANLLISEQSSPFVSGDPSIVLIVRDGGTNKMTMATFSSRDFLDWGTADYTSFAEAGYDFVGDLTVAKNSPYIDVYCRTTEEGFELSEGEYVTIRPSSILVSSAWDFNDNFSTAQQGYRLKQPVVVDTDNLSNWDYPDTTIRTRLKLRGRGRSLRLRFESETGKDFNLLGYGQVQASNGRF